METLKIDVLVIGGGGAGMRAALAAREEGAEVVLVSKKPWENPPVPTFRKDFAQLMIRIGKGIFSCERPKMG